MKRQILTLIYALILVCSGLRVFGQTKINMQYKNGVYEVPCTVNGLKLNFIFDTGASDVSISATEALFMLKNGYLNKTDIIGEQDYLNASGTISAGTVIQLREIEFSGLKLYNVRASVVHSMEAPLLLGQTAIQKLGKYQIDGNTLTIINGPNNSYTFPSNTSNSASPIASGQTIKWMSFEEAVTKSETHPKKIFIDVYTAWCGWCKKMDKSTFLNDTIVSYMNQNYYAVKLDAETKDTIRFRDKDFVFKPEYKSNELAVSLLNGKMSYPSFIFLDETVNLLSPLSGYQTPQQLMPVMKYFGENIYKNKKWEEYMKENSETAK